MDVSCLALWSAQALMYSMHHTGFAELAWFGWAPAEGLAVVVSASHHLYHPSQVALLSPQGKLLREYWHSGHLGAMMTAGLPGSDRDIRLPRRSGKWIRRGVLVALDPLNFDGASREEDT